MGTLLGLAAVVSFVSVLMTAGLGLTTAAVTDDDFDLSTEIVFFRGALTKGTDSARAFFFNFQLRFIGFYL